MFCFSVKRPFSAVRMLNTRFFSWMRRLIQIVFDVEWQFTLQRSFDYSSFSLDSPVHDPRLTCKK